MSSQDLLAILNDRNAIFLDSHLSQFAENTKEFDLLNIFCYGTWKDYLQIESTLPSELKFSAQSEAAKKLKKLTLLTIFADHRKVQYKMLLDELKIDNNVELEELIIDLLGMELLEAKIDEATNTVVCTRASARCVKNNPEDIDRVIQKIKALRERINNALKIASS